MADQSSLDSILEDKPAPAAPPAEPVAPPPPKEPPAAPVAAEAPESKEPREKTAKEQWREKEQTAQAEGLGMERDPVTGQFTKKADAPQEKPKEQPAAPAAPVAPPVEEMTAKEKAAFAAVHDERRKRQALEQEIARIRQGQPPAAPTEQPKGFWDDPEGALKAHEQRTEQTVVEARLNTAEMLARSRHPDFDEKVAEFTELLKTTPGLSQQWLASQDPGEFAYATGKNHLLLKQVGSVEALTAKVRKETEVELRTKWEAEQKAKEEALERQRRELPPSLSDTRGSAAGTKPAWAGPQSLEDILKP